MERQSSNSHQIDSRAGANIQSRGGGAGHYGRRMGAAPLLSVHPRQRPPPFHTYMTVGLLIIYYRRRPRSPTSRLSTSQDPGIISSPLAPPPSFHPVTDRNPFIRRTDAAVLGKLAAVK